MTTFDGREKAFEDKFAHDAELEFRLMARRNRLLGLWAAERLGLSAEETEAYGAAVVQSDFEEAGHEDVFRKVFGDLSAGGVAATEQQVRQAMADCLVEARRQFMEAI